MRFMGAFQLTGGANSGAQTSKPLAPRQTGFCPQLIIANVLGKPSNSDLSDLTVAKVEIVV
jgi:hypothetical protein